MRERSERDDIGAEISTILSSSEVLNRIREFKEEHREAVLGATLEYLCLHGSNNGLDEFIQALHSTSPVVSSQDYQLGKYDALLVSSVAKKLNLQAPLDKDGCRAVGDYLVNRLVRKGYYFHAFNGALEKSIREKGLVPDAEIADKTELETIASIGRAHGTERLLGWYKINSTGKVFFDGHGMNAGRYANASPEWFAQFCAEGPHVRADYLKKSAYYRRDYHAAKQNVIDLCSRWKSATHEEVAAGKKYPNITPEEEQKIIAFFEKYWTRFASEESAPKVALISRSGVHDVDKDAEHYQYDAFSERLRRGGDATYWSDTKVLEFICGYLRRTNDSFVESPIRAENLTIVSLPTYEQIHPNRTEW